MTNASRSFLLPLTLCVVAPAAAQAQFIEVPDWDNSVRFDLVASQNAVRPGDALELAVVAEIVPGYHLYGPEERKPSRTEVLVQSELVGSEEPVFPPVIKRDMLGLGEFDLYEGKIAIRIPFRVGEELAQREELPLDVRVNYQVCTEEACSAPTNTILSLALPIVKEGTTIDATHSDIFGSKN